MADTRRGAARRAGESAFGALLLARNALLLLVAALLVAGGVRESWDVAPHAMFSGRERGDLLLTGCDRDVCSGRFGPEGRTVVLEQSVGREPGETLPVALRPDSAVAVRTGAAGVLLAWLPLTGALLLAAIVIGGGLRWARTAWSLALVSLTALGLTFALAM